MITNMPQAVRAIGLTILILFPGLLTGSVPDKKDRIKWEQVIKKIIVSPAQSEVETFFIYQNTSFNGVSINGVSTSCECSNAKADRVRTEPGESGRISVRIDATHLSGDMDVNVQVTLDGGESYVLTLMLHKEPAYTITPRLVSWPVGSLASKKIVTISIAPSCSLHVQSAVSEDSRISASVHTVKAGETYRVEVSPVDTTQQITTRINLAMVATRQDLRRPTPPFIARITAVLGP